MEVIRAKYRGATEKIFNKQFKNWKFRLLDKSGSTQTFRD